MNKTPIAARVKSMRRLFLLLALGTQLTAYAADPTNEWQYTIAPGDTLIGLAAKLMKPPGDWNQLQEVNRFRDPHHLKLGDKVRIPLALLRSTATVATVIEAQGSVQLVRSRNAIPSPSAGTQLLPGDKIQTGPQSTVLMQFLDTSRMVIAPQSKVVLENLLAYGKTGITETRLKIEEGGIDSQVKRMTHPASKYVVTTPVFNLGVRGTDFRARFDPSSQQAFSEVLEGGVAAQGGKSEVQVGAGFGTLALINQEPKSPKKLLDAPLLRNLTKELDRVPPSLSWQADAGASGYRAQVFADASFQRQLLEGVFSQPVASWPALADGAYVLRVRAIDSEGLEGAAASSDFVVKAQPVPPSPNQPVKGAKLYGNSVHIQWAGSQVGEKYHLQVADNPGFKAPLYDNPFVVYTEYRLALQPGTYYWRLASVTRDYKQGPYGDVQNFVVRRMPVSPTVGLPEVNGKDIRFNLTASDVNQTYKFQVASDSQFTQLLANTTLSQPFTDLPTPAPGTYYLRVKSFDADGTEGEFGSPQSFGVEAGKGLSVWNALPLGVQKPGR